MVEKSRRDRHPKGYVAPKRRDRKMLAMYAKPDLVEWVHQLATRNHTTVQQALEQLLYRSMELDRVAGATPRRKKTNRAPDPWNTDSMIVKMPGIDVAHGNQPCNILWFH